MFTVKVCNPRHTTYFTTTAVDHEKVGDRDILGFYADGENKKILIYPENADETGLPNLPHAERVYLINEAGKTVDIFKYH